MNKRKLLFCLTALLVLSLSACTAGQLPPEREETMESVQTEPQLRNEELIITAGEKKIYGKIFYPATAQKCPAVIFSHGYNGSHSDFLAECRYFSENGFIAYCFDFCGGSGRSKSSGKSTEMTVFTEKEDLLAVIDHISAMEQVDASRVFLLGGSQGGLVTALAAEERAEQIRGMVLYFPAFNIPDDWRKNYPDPAQIPETVDFWGLKLGREFFLSMREFDTYANIGSFGQEVLILHGDQDVIVPLAASRKAVQLYDYAEVIVLPGEGHGFSPTAAKAAMEKALKLMQSLD